VSRTLRALAVIVLVASALGAARVEAQAGAVQLDQYRPAPTVSDGFAISRPDDRGHMRFGARLDLDYALNPLVVESTLGDASTERFSLVEHQLAAHVAVSLGLFERIVVFAGMPVNLLQQGTAFGGLPGGDGAGLGDTTLGARARLFGEPGEAFALALQLRVAFPTALAANAAERYSGEASTTFTPEVLAEVRPASMIRITANVGARLRSDAPAHLATLSVGHELTWGLGITWDAIADALAIYLEGWGSSSFQSFGNARSREATAFEGLLGARGRIAQGLWLGGAVGTGLSRGYGTPDFRGVLTIGWDDGPTREPPAPPPPPPPSDRDHDGLLDEQDACPDQPEDADSFEDENGCPDPDNDADGVLDADDGCVMDPEDRDSFQDEDGCPDPDNDGDGILDTSDACPLEPEDVDGWQDTDGCPEPDNDVDTILDPEDRCPNEPGPASEGGCPQAVRLDVDAGELRILQRIEFRPDSDVLLPAAEAILEEVRAVLAVNVQLTRVRVEGHTDDRHTDEHNLDLSARRARTVVRWLVAHGLEASRFVAYGCGEAHPIEPNRTAAGRQANRRVVFQIIEPPSTGEGTEVFGDCREIDE
jgi:outer membrane protein OmpA-like peptidoglycan-associated protein